MSPNKLKSYLGNVDLKGSYFRWEYSINQDKLCKLINIKLDGSFEKINSLEELPLKIRDGLGMKVNSDDLDKYLSVLEEHSFELDLKEYEINEANFFRHGGNFHDTEITDEKMELFLKNSKIFFETLTKKYIEKIQKFKENHSK